MKIIQVNASYKPAFIYGGPTMSVSRLSEVLLSRNIDIEVLTSNANGATELDVSIGKQQLVDTVPVTYYKRLTRDHTHFTPGLFWALAKKINSSSPRRPIVHIHAWWNLVSVISCFIGVFKRAEVVLSPRGTLSSYSFGNRNNFVKKLIHNFITRPLLKRCHLHATSENEKQELLQLLNPKSITVIPNLVTLAKSKPLSIEDKNGKIKLLFLSRIEHKKGLELLFAALQALEADYHLTIAGTGEEMYINGLKQLSSSLKIDDKISWIGLQSQDTKFDVMAGHHLLILPSYNENFANVVIESLASGTAVLITENVGLSNYVADNDFGWVCKFNTEDLQRNINIAIRDLEKLSKIRETAPAKIRIDFSDEQLSERYIDMYKKALNV